MDIKVLRVENQDELLAFARALAEQMQPDPMERELASWKARWRLEQLTHYLPLGWSFGVWRENKMVGFLLAQPLLFVRGLTQTLWIETIEFEDVETGNLLLESAYKWARDKHFQTVLISEMPAQLKLDRRMDWMKDRIMEVPSSRMI